MSNGTISSISTTQTKTQPTMNNELSLVGEGIIKRLSSILEDKISVTNLSGNIVADSDLENFDKYVPSAKTAIQKGTHVPLPENELDEMSGWVVPLRHQDRLFGTLIVRNKPAPSDDSIPLAKSLAELLLYQMLVMDKIAQENRTLDRFFYDLFEKEQSHEKLIRESVFFNSQFFQIDFSQPKLAGVLILQDFQKEFLENQPVLPMDEHKLTTVKEKMKESLQSHAKINDAIIAYLGLDEFAILLPHKPAEQQEGDKKNKQKEEYAFNKEQLAEAVKELEQKFGKEVHVGIGQYSPDLPGLIKSHKGAKQAARLGRKLYAKQRIYYYQDLMLPIILEQADKEIQKRFVENELGELISQADLMETLATHFESNLNLKKTAYELSIHKNTLYYRLGKIKKILNIDPQEFRHAVKLKVALYLWQINKEESAE